MTEGIHLVGLRISSLLFPDDVVLLGSSGDGLKLTLEWFAAECEGHRNNLTRFIDGYTSGVRIDIEISILLIPVV